MNTLYSFLSVTIALLCCSCGSTKPGKPADPFTAPPARVVRVTETKPTVVRAETKFKEVKQDNAAAREALSSIVTRASELVGRVKDSADQALKESLLALQQQAYEFSVALGEAQKRIDDYEKEFAAVTAVVEKVEQERDVAMHEREEVSERFRLAQSEARATHAVLIDARDRAEKEEKKWKWRARVTWTLLAGTGLILVLTKIRPRIGL